MGFYNTSINNSHNFMSTLQNVMLIESCYEDAWENYMQSKNLTSQEMEDLFDEDVNVRMIIENDAHNIFEGICQCMKIHTTRFSNATIINLPR